MFINRFSWTAKHEYFIFLKENNYSVDRGGSVKRPIFFRCLMGFALSILFIHMNMCNVSAQESEGSGLEQPSIDAESALVIDFENEQILLDQNASEVNEIASMTKMIVQYIVLGEIERGNLTWDEEVTISEYAHQITLDTALANVPLNAGEEYTVRELFEAMSIYSANGATIALAEHIEGSEPAFVDRMRELLESWGIDASQIYNATGLNNIDLLGNHYPGSEENAENQLTAKEVATIAIRLLSDHPEVLEFSSVPKQTFRPGTEEATPMINWNWMLEGLSYEREGVLGLKTGTTNASGGNFAGYAQEGDREVVTVVMNSGDLYNQGVRFEQTDRMLDYGFGNWTEQAVLEEGQSLEPMERVEIYNGESETIGLEAGEDLHLLLPEQVDREELQVNVAWHDEATDNEGRLTAPISDGTTVGQLSFVLPENLESLQGEERSTFEIPLVASESVEGIGLTARISNWFSNLWNGITGVFN